MEAKEIGLDVFIGEKKARFVIPVYQRNYDWKKNNCEKLFADVENIVKTGNSHFLGTVVCQSVDGEYIIIDGQQRIASVILLAKALYEVTDDSNIKEDIVPSFIMHTTGALKNQLRLKPSEYDNAVFEKIMSTDSVTFSEDEKLSALYVNYELFKQKISNSKCICKEIYDALGKLKVVLITLQNENAQEIFESLNSTGLDLTNADLIRNYLIMNLEPDAQEKLYKNYWLQIELLLKPFDAVEKFFVQYLITKRRSDSVQDEKKSRLSKRNLYDTFKDYFKKNFEDVEKFLIDLYHYAKIYRRVIFDENTKFDELSPLDKKFYELTHMLDADNAPIILMYLFDRYERNHFDESTFIKFVDALISLTFRAKVCDYVGISSQFAGNVIARLDKYETLNEEIFWQVLTFGKGDYAFPRDEEFKTALNNEPLFVNLKKFDGCKYLLYSLEKFVGADNLPAFSNTVVEHIIPQRLNEKWRSYLKAQNDSQAHELLVHTLGNLALTVADEKSEKESFDTKTFRFFNSKFSYTKDVAKFANLNSKQIQARAKKLANIAVQIWTLPSKYNEQPKILYNVLTLDSDFDKCTGKKPATISILNVEKQITTWKSLSVEILRQLYSLDTDIFKSATISANFSKYFSTTTEKLRESDKIAEGTYIKFSLDAVDILKNMKRVVENFDEMAGTNIKDEIWFTLK